MHQAQWQSSNLGTPVLCQSSLPSSCFQGGRLGLRASHPCLGTVWLASFPPLAEPVSPSPMLAGLWRTLPGFCCKSLWNRQLRTEGSGLCGWTHCVPHSQALNTSGNLNATAIAGMLCTQSPRLQNTRGIFHGPCLSFSVPYDAHDKGPLEWCVEGSSHPWSPRGSRHSYWSCEPHLGGGSQHSQVDPSGPVLRLDWTHSQRALHL